MMVDIDTLVRYYSKASGFTINTKEYLQNLYNKYVQKNEKTLLDSVAATAAISGIVFGDQIGYDSITPQMEEAFNLTYPNLSIDNLSQYGPEQLEGIVSAWKGKYFEVLVRDKLNSGEWVGEVHLSPGQEAVLADSPVQEGWDLQILDSDGTIAQELQLKATESLGYVQQAIERYPDIDVMTTDEVSGMVDGLFNSGMTNEEVKYAIQSPMEDLLDSPLEEVAENLLPGLPFLIIATREGRKVMVGKKSMGEAFGSSIKDSAKTGAALFAGGTVAALTGIGLVSVPTTFLVRFMFKEDEFVKTVKTTYSKESGNIHQVYLEY